MEAMKKSLQPGRHKPRLERTKAHKSISYDLSGSGRRIPRRPDADFESESDSSHDDWSVDEFSVHGRDGVEEMNHMFRYLGLPGPASLGITRDVWEAVKHSPTGAHVEDSGQSLAEGVHDDFTFVAEPDQYSSQAAPSRRSLTSPREDASQSYFGTRGAGDQRSLSTEAASITEKASRQPCPPAEGVAQPSRDNDGGAKKVPLTHAFPDVVRQAVAHAHRIEADAAAVSSFISQHREEDLSRLGSLPTRLESTQDEPVPSLRGASAGNQIERAHSEPIGFSASRSRVSLYLPVEKTTVVVDVSARVDEQNLGIEQNFISQSEPKIRDLSSKSMVSVGNPQGLVGENIEKDGERPEAELRKPKTGHHVNNTCSISAVSIGSLKRPPPMNILKLQPAQISTLDMLDSLAPDSPGSAPRSPRSDAGRKSLAESDEESTGRNRPGASNGGSTVRTAVIPGSGKKLTLEVPELEAEGFDLNVIGQNPESELQEIARPSYEHVGPNFPWTKGDMLGAGSFGTVYEAVDSDGMWFAVKEVSLVEQDKQAQQCISQLMQEVELLSQFKHDNIVQYLGTQKADGKLYIFLELVSKGSLASVCKRIKLSHSQISAYTRQILKGLKFLHDQNIVHRDIKCANILVDVRGTCKLADFGMAKQIGSLDQAKSCKGSAYWMAPEVIDPKKTYGNPADIWSLGCSILEMATGSPPFGDMEWYRVLWTVGHGNAPPIPDFLSDTAQDFIRRCLEVNPMKRPTAGELLEHPFVKQAGSTTPTNSGQLSAQIVLQSLHPITEENSADFAVELET